jgi:hypothetical protein
VHELAQLPRVVLPGPEPEGSELRVMLENEHVHTLQR